MNIEMRKLIFIQEFVKLQNEEVLICLENFLNKYKSSLSENDTSSMNLEKFKSEIEQSIADAKSGNVFKAKDLKLKIQQWS
jgi:hypothetical protein